MLGLPSTTPLALCVVVVEEEGAVAVLADPAALCDNSSVNRLVFFHVGMYFDIAMGLFAINREPELMLFSSASLIFSASAFGPLHTISMSTRAGFGAPCLT